MLPLILGAGAAFMLLKKPTNQSGAAKSPVIPASPAANPQPGQPSQNYPYRAPMPARVDNSNQPWYVGPLKAVAGPNTNVGSLADMPQAGASVIHSMADIWGSMSNMFGSNDSDSKQNLMSSVDDSQSESSNTLQASDDSSSDTDMPTFSVGDSDDSADISPMSDLGDMGSSEMGSDYA